MQPKYRASCESCDAPIEGWAEGRDAICDACETEDRVRAAERDRAERTSEALADAGGAAGVNARVRQSPPSSQASEGAPGALSPSGDVEPAGAVGGCKPADHGQGSADLEARGEAKGVATPPGDPIKALDRLIEECREDREPEPLDPHPDAQRGATLLFERLCLLNPKRSTHTRQEALNSILADLARATVLSTDADFVSWGAAVEHAYYVRLAAVQEREEKLQRSLRVIREAREKKETKR